MAPQARLRRANGTEVDFALQTVGPADVVAGVPWRTFRSHAKQRHFSGWYWSATTGGQVAYESRLELGRLLLADIDPDVVAIAAQPFLLVDTISGRDRRHVPDFFLVSKSGLATVVNVKPADQLDDPKIAEALGWAAATFEARGWAHEIWTGVDPLVLSNVRFLAAYRRPWLLADTDVVVAGEVVCDGDTVAEAEARLAGHGIADPRPVVLHLVWTGAFGVDLARPLDGASVLGRAA